MAVMAKRSFLIICYYTQPHYFPNSYYTQPHFFLIPSYTQTLFFPISYYTQRIFFPINYYTQPHFFPICYYNEFFSNIVVFLTCDVGFLEFDRLPISHHLCRRRHPPVAGG